MLEQGSGLTAGTDFPSSSPPSGCSPAACSPTCARTPSSSAASTTRAQSGASRSTSRCCEFDERPDLTRPNGVWDLGSAEASELAKLAETTYRDVNIGLANQFARFAATTASTCTRSSRPATRSRSATSTARHRRGRPLHPDLPAHVPVERPRGHRRARGARGQRRDAGVRGRLSSRAPTATSRAPTACARAPYRGGVKETAFSGVFPTVAALRSRAAQGLVHDPMYTDDELRAGLGALPPGWARRRRRRAGRPRGVPQPRRGRPRRQGARRRPKGHGPRPVAVGDTQGARGRVTGHRTG